MTSPSTTTPTTPTDDAGHQAAFNQLVATVARQTSQDSGPVDAGQINEVIARLADFVQLHPTVARGGGTSLNFLLDVNVSVRAELGHATVPIGDILKWEPGSVVELDREVSQPVDLTVCGVLFARGEVVVINDRFAVRIKELLHAGGRKPR